MKWLYWLGILTLVSILLFGVSYGCTYETRKEFCYLRIGFIDIYRTVTR